MYVSSYPFNCHIMSTCLVSAYIIRVIHSWGPFFNYCSYRSIERWYSWLHMVELKKIASGTCELGATVKCIPYMDSLGIIPPL